ncbi:MAG: hypothetical protein HY549_12850 [Elusimicrobia bacterium]|nr:hypothetical protein [Elusimicrobiota bacterium]
MAKAHERLLIEHRYQIQSDGKVVGPEGIAVLKAEFPYLLSRLQGAQRLKALLQLDILLSKSAGGERYLSPKEREEFRKILRDNWPYFTWRMRKKFSNYFSLKELEGLNQSPPAEPGESALAMKDPEPIDDRPPVSESLPEGPAAAAPVAAVLATQPPPPAQAALAGVSAAAPIGGPAAGLTLGLPATDVAKPPDSALEPASPAAAAPLAPSSATAAVAPPPAAASAPLRDIVREEFHKFLEEAPYSREAKNLLRLISDKAPDFARSRALNAVITSLPLILLDPQRLGLAARTAMTAEQSPSGQKSYTLAVSPGPVLHSRKKMFRARQTLLLPESSQAYESLGLAGPKVDALRADAVALGQEPGPWGATRSYPDGSQRGGFSAVQQAGSLLRQLLLLDAARQGWDGWPYGAELFAASAQNLFYARIHLENKDDAFLDPEMRLAFRQWLERPDEYRDFLFHSLSSSRGALLDPAAAEPGRLAQAAEAASGACPQSLSEELDRERARERESLERAAQGLARFELISEKELEAARKTRESRFSSRAQEISPESCQRHWQAKAAGARQTATLLEQAHETEYRFREYYWETVHAR